MRAFEHKEHSDLVERPNKSWTLSMLLLFIHTVLSLLKLLQIGFNNAKCRF